MASLLERLPLELVDTIIAHLALADLQSLRLASKQLQYLTFPYFRSAYFSKRTTTLGPPSLDRLHHVSSRKHLAEVVSLLEIKLLNRADYVVLKNINRVGIYPPPKRFPQVSQIKPEDISQESKLFDYILETEDPTAVVDPLARALRQLSNVKTIRFLVDKQRLDRNPHAKVDDDRKFELKCFRAVLDAVVTSGIRLRELTMLSGTKVSASTKSANLIHSTFDFPLPSLLSFRKSFSKLRSLRLSILTSNRGYEDVRLPGWETGLSQFICAASALEKLTLCFEAYDRQEHFRAHVMESVARSVVLPKLKVLQLYGAAYREEDLVAFAQAHSTSLRRITLANNTSWDQHWAHFPWASLLTSFRDLLHLEYLRITERGTNLPEGLAMDIRKTRDREAMQEKLTQAIDAFSAEQPSAHSGPTLPSLPPSHLP